jgi:hypothetical protein
VLALQLQGLAAKSCSKHGFCRLLLYRCSRSGYLPSADSNQALGSEGEVVRGQLSVNKFLLYLRGRARERERERERESENRQHPVTRRRSDSRREWHLYDVSFVRDIDILGAPLQASPGSLSARIRVERRRGPFGHSRVCGSTEAYVYGDLVKERGLWIVIAFALRCMPQPFRQVARSINA